MSNNPPFSLVRYFYTKSFFSANAKYSAENFQVPELEVNTSLFQDDENPERWSLGLGVGLDENTDLSTAPYDFSISVIGFFYCPLPAEYSQEDLETISKLLYVNGATMLYSAARDHIKTITATGPWLPFLLPTFRFDPEEALLNTTLAKSKS